MLPDALLDAVKFYQEAAPFGVIGSFLLDNRGEKNELFRFKHHYIVHTLEDGILLDILRAMREKQAIRFENQSTRSGRDSVLSGVPVKIFASAATGRRYVCMYNPARRRFQNYRLDYIKSVKHLDAFEEYDDVKTALERNLGLVWGVSFGGKSRKELLCMKLYINEKTEGYIFERLRREGRGGELVRLDENIFLYTKELYDTNEMASWIKSFIGRIIALEGTNRAVIDKFYHDMERMREMYAVAPAREEATV
jgi:predicted DNA-binding transcriptional regulator YafY